jgi:hypothetical protein
VEEQTSMWRRLTWILPAALIVAVVGGTTALMIGDSDEEGSGAPPASAANPHPAAGTFVPNDTELADCTDQACYEQAFANLLYYEGPKAAFAVFDREMAAGGPIASGCHRIAHRMGGAGLERYDNDVSLAFSKGSASCWSGYYHGILEWSLGGLSGGELADVVRGICDDVRGQGTFLLYQCVHGLGHGVMITTGYDLPGALDGCRALKDHWDRTSCWGGVFMENVATGEGSPIEVTGEPEWLDDRDLLYPCDDDKVVPRVAKERCYVMVTSRILQTNGQDFAGAAAWCRRAERDFITVCFQSLGRDASGSSIYDPQQTVERCRVAEEYMPHCIWGAARDFTMRHAGTEEASEFCAATPANLRPDCFHGIGSILPSLEADPQRQIAACRKLSDQWALECIEGTGRATPAVQVPN